MPSPDGAVPASGLPAEAVSALPAARTAGRGRPFGRLRNPFRRRREPEPPRELSLVEHLVELRHRVFVSVLSLVPGTIVGFILGDELIRILKKPLPTDRPLIALNITEPFMIRFEIALVVGLVVGMPVILLQLWRFISPGLTPRERSIARPWVPFALVFFAVGVGLAYMVLPYASNFLFGFQTSDLQLMLTADAYFGFVTRLFVTFGLVMEFPIILVLLSKAGIVTHRLLAANRRRALLIVTIVAALIAPGGDFVTPIVLAAAMYGLYEGSIVVIRLGTSKG
jgi:sec-independent protein translocase protein TatC